ncbi:glycosyltransferase family 2 protein [Cellulomonas bogoriensis]|uniref:Polypeptide N-acetylgalactosaminyltransferase n=1 Tax=Cellulomonas bogoriensis 69B4 = DSM 16987 TaxID=1386082 RepID=A0A0A0C154_9CELL|nr:glycosyltransferase [Cellulomonas bogoriensis]KGM13946.1 polypeptide N-acetylgalactosaminyltransferase [Cellulomonas bogoriensis 69B4 = DSM 16987]
MPRLSVLMPVRDGEATVGPAVRSTLRALPCDAELVVYDDVSSDRTPQVLAQVHDARLRVVRGEHPAGVAGGLNHLLECTDSLLVARMDADDVVLPGRFTRQLRAVARHDVVFSTVVDWRPDARRLRPNAPVPVSADAFGLHLLVTNPVSHPTMLARRSALDAVGGYRDLPSEDYDLWVRLALAGRTMTRLATPALAYRVHGAQVTASDAWRARSWADPRLGEVYGDLSERLLGERFARLVSCTEATPDVLDALDDFEERMVLAAARLSTGQARFLLAKLRRRLAAVRGRLVLVGAG